MDTEVWMIIVLSDDNDDNESLLPLLVDLQFK